MLITLQASGDFWPHKRLMERLTILDYDIDRRVPYYRPNVNAAAEPPLPEAGAKL